MRRARAVLVVAVLGLAFSTVTAAETGVPASAYSIVDLPATPVYCHPAIPSSGWVQEKPCSIDWNVSSSYSCCDEHGLIDYTGLVFTFPKVGVTAFGDYWSPPRFTLTASQGPWGGDASGARVIWGTLNFSQAFGGLVTAKPIAPCAPDAANCTYEFDTSLRYAVLNGLGSPPKWLYAPIEIDVVGNTGGLFYFGYTYIAIGFYRTDNRAPVAVISHSLTSDPTAVDYNFDARNTFDRDGDPIVKYVWEFGDGTTAQGMQVQHTYAAPGSYVVKLHALDNQGAEGTAFVNLGSSVSITSLTASPIPRKIGDEFDITATVRNESSQPIPCMGFSRAPDIRPAASFTKVSGPPAITGETVPRKATKSATWRMRLTGPVPDSFEFIPFAYGGGFGGCPGSGGAVTYTSETWFIKAPGPFTSWAALVARDFADVLGRSPTAAESSSWVAKLQAATADPADVVAGLRRSSENVANVDPVARLYRAYFLRIPDYGGLTYWIKRRRAGVTLDAISATFARSPEFTNRYGPLTNAQFVNLVYKNVLGRPGDAGGVAHWTKVLDEHTKTRGQVMIGFSESAEYKAKQAENVDAAVAYAFLLGRSPTTAEADTWFTKVRNGDATPTSLIAGILASPDYAARVAGP
ncbi:MAG: hypothetical protein JWM05_3624 [Acidimicrobiales bacterium]|nr:hypothetical protein [Acidimicrobiales bacterium]